MTKILILYYSMYGHIETLAHAMTEAVAGVEGVHATLKRVPETMTREALEAAGAKTDQEAPVAAPSELPDYDGVIFGTPTRFGNMCGQMRTFLDQTGSLWVNGALIGRVGSVFTSTATGGGNETTITSFWHTLAHHGFVIVGLPYSTAELLDISEVRGGSPYGASTLAGADGSRHPTEKELAMIGAQGRHVADITRKLRS